jgi:hypothetical protein
VRSPRSAPAATPRDARPEAGLGLALIAAPGPAEDLARALAGELPTRLGERIQPSVTWSVPVAVEPAAGEAGVGTTALIDRTRERMIREGCDLAVCLTDLPLRIRHRPVVADASATHGVGLISLPALGAVQLRRRASDVVVRLVDGLLGETGEPPGGDAGRRRRVGRRLAEIAARERRVVAEDDDVDLRFVAAVVRGHLRLLGGMLRANRPWRLVARLSRALTATVGTVVLSLMTADVWRVADALDGIRLVALAAVALAAIVLFLILAHGLWERPVTPQAREQAVLFNVATLLTLLLGVTCLYVALFVLALAGAGLALDDTVVSRALGHPATFGDYVKIACLAASLATVAGALGAGLESDGAVREAAYGYRPGRGG